MNDVLYDVACAMDADDRPISFLARSSGVYQSNDAGDTWHKVSEGHATAVEVSPSFARDQTVFAGLAGGICRSTDHGASWQTVSLGSPAPIVSCMAISPSFENDATVLAGTMEDGVFASRDGGHSWASSNTGLFTSNIVSIAISPDFRQDHLMVLNTEACLFRSANSGKSWQEIESFDVDSEVATVALSDDIAQDGFVLAVTNNGRGYQSRNTGRSWLEVTGLPTELEVVDGAILGKSSDQYTIVLFAAYSIMICTIRGGVVTTTVEAASTSVRVSSASMTRNLEGNQFVLLGLDDGTTRKCTLAVTDETKSWARPGMETSL